MEKENSNNRFNQSIDSIYDKLQKEISSIISNFCEINYDKKPYELNTKIVPAVSP